MTRLSNREVEYHYFEQFRTHFPIPNGVVEYTDKPDVIIHGERKLGVEIANLYLAHGSDPNSEQRQHHFREAVLQQAQARHLKAGGKKIELTVSFDPTRPIKYVKAVVNALADTAASIQVFPRGEISPTYFSNIPEVSFVYHNPTEYPDAVWRVCQSYTVPSLSLTSLAATIAEKHSKLPTYKQCHAFWLLLVVDYIDRAQDQDIRWPEPGIHISSPFERIIVYKPQFAAWTDVPST